MSLAVLSLRIGDAPGGDFHQAAGKGSQYNPEAEPGAWKGEASRSSQETATEAQGKSDPGRRVTVHSGFYVRTHRSQEVLKSSLEPGVSPRWSQWLGTRKACRADGVSS